MRPTPTRNVAPTPEKTFIGAQVASGRYGGSSEVARSGLRLLVGQSENRVGGSRRRAG